MTFIYHILGHLLRLDDVENIQSIDFSFAEPWAEQGGAAWVLFAAFAAAFLGSVFYFKYQPKGRTPWGIFLGVCRAALLVLLVTALANPQASIKYAKNARPVLWMLFDGTDSMAIQDSYPAAERKKLNDAVGLTKSADVDARPTRQEFIQRLLTRENDNLLKRLSEKYRLQPYQFQRAGGVDALTLSGQEDQKLEPKELSDQLTTAGKFTAIGDALRDLAQRKTENEAGVVLFSDFGQNSGLPPVGTENSPAARLHLPIYTVGVGPTEAVDLTVDLQTPPVMKKDERSTVGVIVRASGLDDRRTTITLTAKRLDATVAGDAIPVGQREVTLKSGSKVEQFEFTPKQPGRYLFTAEATGFPDVQAVQNNRAEREVIARDDFLRLMYVEYEPTWEWRFVKEVFHRDPLVGQRGFRTFLRSADAKVRQTNELFLPTLTPKRSDFFATDVIFIGDMPAGTLTPRFCEMTKEFVEKFGGGLVIISGPRFGPSVLADTPLADMLPVVLDPGAKVKDQQEFRMQLTPASGEYDFMRLGGAGTADVENGKAWGNLGRLPWYQPVANKHKDAVVLAEHPSDLCNDDKTKQPLIAIRKYGRGEVVYLGFDETWRLRKKYGELYYRQFWGQMIHRLGLSHLLGDHQRFVVRTDQQQYKEDDKVTVTIEAYDANYEPLTEQKIPDRKIAGESWLLPKSKAGEPGKVPVRITQVRDAVFEARFPVTVAGEHRLKVRDPVTNETVDVTFQVRELSSERRSAVRDANLEREIAQVSHGKNYTLDTVDRLPDDLNLQPKVVYSTSVQPVWNNWLAFGVIIALMLCEWFVRKMINLP